jgi:hypothetical protein
VTNPDTEPDAACAPAWFTEIAALLERSRHNDPTEPVGPPPAWLPQAVHLVGGWLHATILTQIHQATTTLRTQLDDHRRDHAVTAGQLRRLRDEIRLYLAERIASGDSLDRDDANDALRGWSIDPLPARFTVTLNATIAITVIAEDSDDAAAQAQRILDELSRDQPDETVTIAELHTDDVVQHDELPDPITLG